MVASKPTSGFLSRAFRAVQSALFPSFNFVGSAVTGAAALVFKGISIVAAYFTPSRLGGRQLNWDPFWEALEKSVKGIFRSWSGQTLHLPSETLRTFHSLNETVVETSSYLVNNAAENNDTIVKSTTSSSVSSVYLDDDIEYTRSIPPATTRVKSYTPINGIGTNCTNPETGRRVI